MTLLDIRLVGANALAQRLASAMGQLAQNSDLLTAIGAKLARNIRLRFDTKTAPSGYAWAPLKDSTVRAYQKKNKGNIPGSLLMRSNLMRKSVSSIVIGNTVQVGLSAPYAGYHETGTRRMARRGMVFALVVGSGTQMRGMLAQSDLDDINAIVKRYLRAALKDV